MKKRYALIALAICFAAGCEKNSDDGAVAEAPLNSFEIGDSPDESEHDEHHDAHADGVHLGEHMYELSRRFSALWFAGKSGNAAMVKYQTHEMEEVIGELEESRPTEADVDVVERLHSDVEVHFEALEKAAESNDTKAFESTYRKVMNNCTVCHADTRHPFIQVKIPEYNPYPNLAF